MKTLRSECTELVLSKLYFVLFFPCFNYNDTFNFELTLFTLCDILIYFYSMASVDYTKVEFKEKSFYTPPLEEVVDGEYTLKYE